MHPYLPLPKRDVEIDKYYAVLGRSVAYCTEFEINCRHVAHHFEIAGSSDYALEIYLISKDGTLNSKLANIQKQYKLPLHTVEALNNARISRNWIVHEAAEYLVQMILTPESRRAFETDIVLRLTEVALGNQIVLDIYRNVRGNKPDWVSSDIVAYSSAIQTWIAVDAD